ncbi:pilus assembly protein PilP [Desulfomarina sp.]
MNRLFTLFKAVFLTTRLIFLQSLVLCFFLNIHWTLAGQTQKTVPALEAEDGPPFEYVLEDRPDPFVPFITEKATAPAVDMNEIVEKNEPLTGMQLFEPGQLTLVALLRKGTDEIAMVQDFTGKGYVITEGIKIGRRGVVKDITSQNVIIEETAETRAGKKIITEVVMTLKKEGEE